MKVAVNEIPNLVGVMAIPRLRQRFDSLYAAMAARRSAYLLRNLSSAQIA